MASIQLSSIDAPRMTPPVREKWQDHAACASEDPEIFFPGLGGKSTKAKDICRGCDVRLECLRYVLKAEEGQSHREGVYAGLSGLERKRLIKFMRENPSKTLEEAYDAITSKNVKKTESVDEAA